MALCQTSSAHPGISGCSCMHLGGDSVRSPSLGGPEGCGSEEGRCLLSRGPLFVAGEGDPHTEGDDRSSKAIPSNLISCGSGLAEYIGVRHLWLHKHS